MKTRMQFAKIGSSKFIGHLDCMRFFQKALRRAKLDVAYSRGFSPHQLMSFASPLGVGLTSEGEYIDVEFNTLPEMPLPELASYLNRFMTDEIFVKEIQVMPDGFKNSMSLLRAADYRITGSFPENFEEKWTGFIGRGSIPIMKKSGKQQKKHPPHAQPKTAGGTPRDPSLCTIDIRPHILEYAFSLPEFSEKTGEEYENMHSPEKGQAIYLQLSSGSEVNIKPQLVMDAFFQFCGQEPPAFSLQFHRLQMYFRESPDGRKKG